MDDIFSEIDSQIDQAIENLKAEFEPSEVRYEDAICEIYLKLIPIFREDIPVYETNEIINQLTCYRKAHQDKYDNIRKVELSDHRNVDEHLFWKRKDDKFYHGILIKVSNLMIAAFRDLYENQEQSPVENKSFIDATKPTIPYKTAKELYEILKGYFDPKQHDTLKNTIQTGDRANSKLIFKGSANKLTDTFKQLFEAGLLTGCDKQNLIKWIIANFQYYKRRTPNNFVFKTTESNISGNVYPCKNPIIKIENDKVIRAKAQ